MDRARIWFLLSVLLAIASLATPAARADDGFLSALSKLATREIRKQLRDKRHHFAQGPLEGYVEAVEPDTRLQAVVHDFKLGNDLLTSNVTASGRFKIEGKVNQEADISALVDVQLTFAAEARFTKEGDKFFVEPRIKDMAVKLAILQISPENLNGGADLLSGLAMAAFGKNKDKILAEANKRLGKRPF